MGVEIPELAAPLEIGKGRGSAPMKPMSNDPAWVEPSAPTRPARSMAKRTGRDWIATAWTTWS